MLEVSAGMLAVPRANIVSGVFAETSSETSERFSSALR